MVSSMNTYGQNDAYNQDYSALNNQYAGINVPTARKSGISTPAMMALGGITGGGIGFFINKYPVKKDGTVSDSFSKKAFAKHIKKNLSADGKEFFNQLNNVLKKIGKVKNTEDFKKLLKNNQKICSTNINGFSLENIINTVNTDNLKAKKETLKNGLQNWLDYNINNMKDSIATCWDKEQKKFVKPEKMDEKIFKVIKNTNMDSRWFKGLKYGGIGAVIAGVLTVCGKFISSKFTSNQ